MSILTDLRDAGLTVVEHPGWETRGRAWPVGSPVGVMLHHTAAPVPYPVTNLAGDFDGRVKCNLNVKPDGTVVVIAGRACNYSSGPGSNVVLAETKKAVAPRANARERGLVDNTDGNPFYFNFEVDHLGDGSAVPAVQYAALVTACRVVLDTYNRVPDQIVSHAEWTARKIDPYWNGSRRTAAVIRTELNEDTMTPEEQAALNWLVTALKSKPSDSPPWGATWWTRYKARWGGTPPGPVAPVTHIQEAYVIEKLVADMVAKAIADAGTGTGVSEQQVKDMIAKTGHIVAG